MATVLSKTMGLGVSSFVTFYEDEILLSFYGLITNGILWTAYSDVLHKTEFRNYYRRKKKLTRIKKSRQETKHHNFFPIRDRTKILTGLNRPWQRLVGNTNSESLHIIFF